MNFAVTLNPPRGRPLPPKAPARHRLQPGRKLSVESPARRTRGCEAGCVWVTTDDSPLEQVLHRGERCTLPGRARVIVYALEAGTQLYLGPSTRPGSTVIRP